MAAEEYLSDLIGQLLYTDIEFCQGDLPGGVFALEGVYT